MIAPVILQYSNCGNILPFGVENVAWWKELSQAGCQREGEISRAGCEREEISRAGCQREGEGAGLLLNPVLSLINMLPQILFGTTCGSPR